MNPTAPASTVRDQMGEQGRGLRRRDGGLLRPLRLVALLGVAAALLYAPSALAATLIVDKTGDTTSGEACNDTTPNDCSLRSAVDGTNNNIGPDTIHFDPTVFNGGVASTVFASSAMVIQGPVAIDGSGCVTGSTPKPCVRLASFGGAHIGLDVASASVSIKGIAFTQASSAIQVEAGIGAPTVTGSWFGVALDGTTLLPNDAGIAEVNDTGGTIGGSTAANRNVFASNTSEAIAIAGSGGGQAIKGNYFGALPNASLSSSPGAVGFSMSGSNSGVTIGGDATTAGQCDGECNLIVGYSQDGIRTINAGGTPSSLTIRGNFIGLGLNGTADQGNGGSGILLDVGSNGDTIGGTGTKRNYIAGNNEAGIKAFGIDSLNATNNYIGLSADGSTSIPNTGTFDGHGLQNFGGTGGTVSGNRFGGNGLRLGGGLTVTGNVIGVGPAGQDLGLSGGESGLEIDGNSNTVTGNTIGNVKTAADEGVLLSSGAGSNTIQGNFIGTTSNGTPEPNAGDGLQLGGSNIIDGNMIGGFTGADENVISNNGGDAISDTRAGTGNRFLLNVGKNNGAGPNDLFIDLGDFGSSDGPGNPGLGGVPNDGVQAPAITTPTSTSISGTANPNASIFIYTTYSAHGDVRESMGSTAADPSGNWSVNNLPNLPAGQCVTANQVTNDAPANDASELAVPKAVGGGACVLHPTSTIDSGPDEGTATADTTPTFDFSSTESGVTFECKVDGGSFSTCTSPFTPSTALSEDTHTFTVRGLQTPSNPGLGPDAGAPVTRTFTVDTTGPVVSFTSGPGEGATIDTSSTSIGFSASEPGTFECKLDSGAFGACTSPFAVSSLAEGAHTVQIRGTDTAGNAGAVVARNFSVKFPVVTPPPTTPTTPKKKCKKAKKGAASVAKKNCKKKKN